MVASNEKVPEDLFSLYLFFRKNALSFFLVIKTGDNLGGGNSNHKSNLLSMLSNVYLQMGEDYEHHLLLKKHCLSNFLL